MAKCSYCQAQIIKNEDYQICSECKMPYHTECWKENKGCGTNGCPNAPERGGTGEAYQAQWEKKSKTCPYCQEEIPMKSIVCPLCKSNFGTVHTLSTEEVRRELRIAAADKAKKAGYAPIWIFVASLTGFLAPLVLLLGGLWYWSNMESLKDISPTRNLIAIAGLCLSTFYFALMLIGSAFY